MQSQYILNLNTCKAAHIDMNFKYPTVTHSDDVASSSSTMYELTFFLLWT